MKQKWSRGRVGLIGFLMVIILPVVFLEASATWRHIVNPGLTVGDIIYADRKDRLTNLNAGLNGKVLQAAGAETAPAYVAKNIMRRATIHNFATAAASWTLSADELLCEYLATTNANGAATIQATGSDGLTFVFRNGSGQNNTFHSGAGTGVTVATGVTAKIYYDSTIGDYLRISTDY